MPRLRAAAFLTLTGLLAQLAAVGGALAGAPGPRLESLGWRERTLELQIVAANTDAIARFTQGITTRGLSADVASTTKLICAVVSLALAGFSGSAVAQGESGVPLATGQ